jgi:hypothetical protein
MTAADILRAAKTVDDESEEPVSGSALIVGVVGRALAKAENAFSDALAHHHQGPGTLGRTKVAQAHEVILGGTTK